MNYVDIKNECEKIEGVTIELQEVACQCRIRDNAGLSAEDKIRDIVGRYGCDFIRGSGNVRIHRIVPRKDVSKIKPDVRA